MPYIAENVGVYGGFPDDYFEAFEEVGAGIAISKHPVKEEWIRLHLPPVASKVPAARYEAAVTALEECLTLKRYSWRTVKTYKNCFRQFIRHYNDIKSSQITRRQIDEYILYLIREKRLSESHQNQVERLWKFLRKQVTSYYFYEHYAEFR